MASHHEGLGGDLLAVEPDGDLEEGVLEQELDEDELEQDYEQDAETVESVTLVLLGWLAALV